MAMFILGIVIGSIGGMMLMAIVASGSMRKVAYNKRNLS